MQRQASIECYQLLIYDNTYKTNRFKLPMGIFSGVNRSGLNLPHLGLHGCVGLQLRHIFEL